MMENEDIRYFIIIDAILREKWRAKELGGVNVANVYRYD